MRLINRKATLDYGGLRQIPKTIFVCCVYVRRVVVSLRIVIALTGFRSLVMRVPQEIVKTGPYELVL